MIQSNYKTGGGGKAGFMVVMRSHKAVVLDVYFACLTLERLLSYFSNVLMINL